MSTSSNHTKAKNFCVLHNEAEQNHISSSIPLGLQLHVSALYVGHLQLIVNPLIAVGHGSH